MVNFKIPPKYQPFTCSQCGQEDRGPQGQTLCTMCRYYQSHPEEAPDFFTWTRTSSGWAATAKWPEHDPFPEPGSTITVHRQNGSTSQHTARELRSQGFDSAANLRITLDVI